MDDFQFLNAALNIGLALNKDRKIEDHLRSQGKDSEANSIYLQNKESARVIFSKLGISAKEFDKKFAAIARKNHTRINVKLERLFG